MDQTRMSESDTSAAIADLARIALSGERRLQRLESLLRWTVALFLLTLTLALYALSQAFGATGAQAQAGWPHAAPGPLPDEAEVAETAAKPWAGDFRARIEELRERVAEAEVEALDPGHVLAVILHDMKDVLHETRQMLAVMPQMAEDMHELRGDMERIAGTMDSMDDKMTGIPAMAEEMRHLNINIDIMTTSIDSTMGRMGRMMPYMW
jgi:signal transduction histidine kinase